MAEYTPEHLVFIAGSTGQSSTGTAVPPQSSLLPMEGPSQAVGAYMEMPAQSVVQRIVRSGSISMTTRSGQGSLRSVAESKHSLWRTSQGSSEGAWGVSSEGAWGVSSEEAWGVSSEGAWGGSSERAWGGSSEGAWGVSEGSWELSERAWGGSSDRAWVVNEGAWGSNEGACGSSEGAWEPLLKAVEKSEMPSPGPWGVARGSSPGPWGVARGPSPGPWGAARGPSPDGGPSLGPSGAAREPCWNIWGAARSPCWTLCGATRGTSMGPSEASKEPCWSPWGAARVPSMGSSEASKEPCWSPWGAARGPSMGPSEASKEPCWSPSEAARGPSMGPSEASKEPCWSPSEAARGPSLRLVQTDLEDSQGFSEANWEASIGNLQISSRDRTESLLRDQMPCPEDPQGIGTKIQLYSLRKFTLRNGCIINLFSATASGLFKEGECLQVCADFLVGKCPNNSDCPYYHTLFPFHWQFHHKKNDSWHSVPLGTQMHLEMIYSDPNFETAIILAFNKTWRINMESLKILNSHQYDLARRFCCESGIFIAPSNILFWYNGWMWVPYSPGVTDLSLNFLERKQKEPDPSIISRPEYVPLYQIIKYLSIWFSDGSRTCSWWGEEATDSFFGAYPYRSPFRTQMEKNHFSMMEIAPSEPAYKQCCELFHKYIPDDIIVLRIYRFYNPSLWKVYQREKKWIKRFRFPGPLEHHLFYQGSVNFEELTKNGFSYRGNDDPPGLSFCLKAKIEYPENTCKYGNLAVLAKVLIGEKPPDDKDNTLRFYTVFQKELTYPYFFIYYKHVSEPIYLNR